MTAGAFPPPADVQRPEPLTEPIIDVCQHPPRYMVRCSNCGIFAEMQSPAEAVALRDSHRCTP